MRTNHSDPMQISEGELQRATADLDEFHNETFPSFQQSLTTWADEARAHTQRISSKVASRRTFLMGSGVVVGGVALAACGSSKKSSSTTTTSGGSSTTGAAGGAFSGDAEVAATAASLENLAVAAYTMGLAAATAGKLGAVPPAVATFAMTAKAQHTAHAGAFNAVVTAAGKPMVTKPDPAVLPAVQTAFGKVTNVTGLAMLALELENEAANTYLSDLGMDLKSSQLIGALATIQPVERMHVSILYFVLGQYPVPETFQMANIPSGDAARPPTDINM
ncbi:MAG: hypothetical protein DLM54_06630 [Acidimicrobiales bacterium]|nr:MAG: hypothetical protein DLM54_06630 [Acidimicrobiales bacterium]